MKNILIFILLMLVTCVHLDAASIIKNVGTVHGTIKNKANAPIANAYISIIGVDGSVEGETRSNLDGNYQITYEIDEPRIRVGADHYAIQERGINNMSEINFTLLRIRDYKELPYPTDKPIPEDLALQGFTQAQMADEVLDQEELQYILHRFQHNYVPDFVYASQPLSSALRGLQTWSLKGSNIELGNYAPTRSEESKLAKTIKKREGKNKGVAGFVIEEDYFEATAYAELIGDDVVESGPAITNVVASCATLVALFDQVSVRNRDVLDLSGYWKQFGNELFSRTQLENFRIIESFMLTTFHYDLNNINTLDILSYMLKKYGPLIIAHAIDNKAVILTSITAPTQNAYAIEYVSCDFKRELIKLNDGNPNKRITQGTLNSRKSVANVNGKSLINFIPEFAAGSTQIIIGYQKPFGN